MKICLKCNKEHKKRGKFCGRSCGNSRILSEEYKKQISLRNKNNPNVLEALKKARIKSAETLTSPSYKKKLSLSKTDNCICKQCNKSFYIQPSLINKRKFCNGKCRNLFNNKFIKASRSKAEIALQKKLTEKYPNMDIRYNDRIVLNGLELDVYFPSLKIAIEWNGIFHYKNIHKNNLAINQKKDNIKMYKCSNLGIKLLTVKDLYSNPKFISKEIDKILNMIDTFIN